MESIIETYYFRDIEKIPSGKMGIYSWHLVLVDHLSDEISNYFQAYNSKHYSANIKGWLNDTFEGKLLPKAPNTEYTNVLNKTLLTKITEAISPPIYIGMSNDLNDRLRQHKEKFYSFNPEDYQEILTLHDDDIDTSNESAFFGERLAYLLEQYDETLNENSLYIKTLQIEGTVSRTELLQTEKLLNRTYKPILGRK